MIVGMVGNLDPTKEDFREFLDRYHRNKLFLGIRYGNVWPTQDLVDAIQKPSVIDNMKVFAQTGLTLEVANPRVNLIEATLRLSDKVPDLRIVLGHLQALPLPTDPGVMKSYSSNLKDLHQRNVYVKVSGLAKSNPKEMMDFIWDIYGEDRIVYAGRNKASLEFLKNYTMAKGRPAAEKFFWKNSISAFNWIKRDPKQPQLS